MIAMALAADAVGRRHVHAAVVLDVDLDAGALDDAADHLAARADDVADLVDRDLDGDDARREGEMLLRGRPGLRPSCRGCAAGPARLLERLRMISVVMPATLMSICSAVMPFAGAGDLEVHVAVVVLGAGDVGEHAYLPVFSSMMRPMATPATGALSGTPASIIASEPPQTEAIDDEPFDSRMSETTRTV
jgi:hypothetical protein